MSINEKKNEVLQALSNTKDQALIEEVYELLHPEQSVSDIEIEKLPQPLQQKINKALEDYKSGNYITHEQMKAKLQQWLIK
jgi:predicted transcriptional regulator